MLQLQSMRRLPKLRFRSRLPIPVQTIYQSNRTKASRPAYSAFQPGALPVGSSGFNQHPQDISSAGTATSINAPSSFTDNAAKMSLDPPSRASDPYQTANVFRPADYTSLRQQQARQDNEHTFNAENPIFGVLSSPLYALGAVTGGLLQTGANVAFAVGGIMSSVAQTFSSSNSHREDAVRDYNRYKTDNYSASSPQSSKPWQTTRTVPVETITTNKSTAELLYPTDNTTVNTSSGLGDDVGHMYSPSRFMSTVSRDKKMEIANSSAALGPSISDMQGSPAAKLASSSSPSKIRSKLDELDQRDLEFDESAGSVLEDAKAAEHVLETKGTFAGTYNVGVPMEDADFSKGGTAYFKPGSTMPGLHGIDGGIAAATDTLHNTGETMAVSAIAEDKAAPATVPSRNRVVDLEDAPIPPSYAASFDSSNNTSFGKGARAFHSSAAAALRIYSVSQWDHASLMEHRPSLPNRASARAASSKDVPGDNAAARTPTATYEPRGPHSLYQGVKEMLGQALTGKGDSQTSHVEDPPLGRWDRRHFNMEEESRYNPMLEDVMGGNASEWRETAEAAEWSETAATDRQRLAAMDNEDLQAREAAPRAPAVADKDGVALSQSDATTSRLSQIPGSERTPASSGARHIHTAPRLSSVNTTEMR